jgi:multidrug efflux pump subunit AcrA (membrane-fusion protein)
MKKNKINTGILIGIFLLLLTACSPAAPDAEPVILAEESSSSPIAEGTLEPGKTAQLAFGTSGLVEEIFYEEGDAVKIGDIIAQLTSSSAIEAEISSAESEYMHVQQALTDLDLYAAVERGSALQTLIDTKDAFYIAQEEWDDYDVDEYEDDLGDAQEDIQDAQADLDDALADLEEYLNLDEDNRTRKRYQDIVDDARSDLHQAEQEYSDIENEYLQAKLDFELAAGNLATAQAEYDRKQNGPDVDQLALLQAQSAALEQTISGFHNKLASIQIVSPINGFVMQIDLKESEFASVGIPLVMVADTSSWIVKTDDISEFDVVQIQSGQKVRVQVDALPEITIQGSVESIDQVATRDQGDVTYPITISIDESTQGLRWGMTVSVQFQPIEE